MPSTSDIQVKLNKEQLRCLNNKNTLYNTNPYIFYQIIQIPEASNHSLCVLTLLQVYTTLHLCIGYLRTVLFDPRNHGRTFGHQC